MSNLTVEGRVKQVFPAETRGTFTFRVLWLVIDEGSQYPQTIEVQFAQAKAALLDNVNEGDTVTVHFNLRGREWTKDNKTSVFNTVSGWKLDKTAVASIPPQMSTVVEGNGAQDLDSLPF